MSSLKFILKHHFATVLCFFKGRVSTDNYRSLMFHSVYDRSKVEKDLYSVSFSQYQEFLNELHKENVQFTRFDSFSEDSKFGISVTFDDGFKDNLQLVLPFMLERNIPFTIFVASDFLDEKYTNYLSKEDLRELSSHSLVTLGAHGKSHRPLTEMSLSEAQNELRISKSILEEVISREVTAMSFPHGKYNSQLVEAALEIGFKKLGTSDPFPNKNNLGMLISRQCIYSCDTRVSFRQKIRGLWDWVWQGGRVPRR